MNKKLLSFFMACVFCLSGISAYAAQEGSNSYLREIELVRSLEIMYGYEDGSFGGNNNVTRMEYTAVIVRLLGYEETAKGYNKSTFSDISDDSWGKGYVAVASNLGLVDGTGDGKFSPQNNVTFNQAVKIMVSALGYKQHAEAKGGYPLGYRNVALSLKIIEGLSSNDVALTRAQVAKLIANSLEVKLESDRIHSSQGNYIIDQVDETLLSKLGYYKKEGIVLAAYGIDTTNSQYELEKNEIIIGDELLYTKVSDCNSFILKRVIYYAKEDENGRDTVHFIQEKAYGNDELSIDAKEIIRDGTTLSQIKYKQSRIKTQTLPANLVIIYNGKLVASSDYSDALLKPNSGSVTLLDTDDNNTYEYAVVNEYENYIVDAINLPKLYDKFSRVINLDEEDEISSAIYFDGVKVLPEEIKAGDVLSIAKSLDGKSMRIEISRECISGYLSAMDKNDRGDTIFMIDDAEYALSELYSNAYVNNTAPLKKLSMGDSADFYLDVFGEIAYSEPTTISQTGTYGYLIDILASQDFDFFGRMKIMTAENKFESFECAEKIRFGRNVGGSYTTSKVTIEEIYNAVSDNDVIDMQMVKFDFDSEGKINSFYLADNNPFSSNFSRDVSSGTHYYANGVYAGKYILNGDTAWFDIPESGLYTDLFSAGYAPDFLKDSSSYTLELYDVEDDFAQAVFCKSNSPRYLTYETKVIIDKVNSPIMLIDKVKDPFVDGETRLCVSGYVDAEYKTVVVSEELASDPAAIRGLKRGAIIQYETNYAEIERAETSDELEVMWVYNTLHDFNITTTGFYRKWDNTYIESNNAGLGTIFGVVTDVKFPYFTISYEDQNGNAKNATLQIGTQPLYYSFDMETMLWEEIDQREIQPGETLFIRTRYNRLREVVILKN